MPEGELPKGIICDIKHRFEPIPLMMFLRTIALITVLGVGSALWATEKGTDKIFLVVGYRAFLTLSDPETALPEDKKIEAQTRAAQTVQTYDAAVLARLNQWRETHRLVSTIFNTPLNKLERVISDLTFSGDNNAHYVVLPM